LALKRVREVIRRRFGVQFGEVRVWRLLDKLGFSTQKPEVRATEREETAIALEDAHLDGYCFSPRRASPARDPGSPTPFSGRADQGRVRV